MTEHVRDGVVKISPSRRIVLTPISNRVNSFANTALQELGQA